MKKTKPGIYWKVDNEFLIYPNFKHDLSFLNLTKYTYPKKVDKKQQAVVK